ncbi:MAG TPA: alpha/beta hydrolase [Gemmatimonadales bacterium]|nr:alpha/beta hydrolase [Gemmatimonadales bacterium]
MRALHLAVLLPAVAAACGGVGRGSAAQPGATAPASTTTPVAAAPLVMRAVRLHGTDLAFADQGGGIPVVLVHGTLESAGSWRPQIDSFANHFRVIAYSRRYHAPNAARPDGQAYGLALHADDLIALLEALGLERVHLVGSGYGAAVALVVTLRRPDLVRSLVLEEPPLFPWLARTPDGDSLRRAFETGVVQPARQAFARGDSVEAVRRFVDGESGRPGRFDGLPQAQQAALLRLAFALRLELGADPAVYMPALACPAVGAVRNPVLIVTGARSPRRFHLITEELARCLPAKELLDVPGAGHSAHADNPAFYNATVVQFLLRN